MAERDEQETEPIALTEEQQDILQSEVQALLPALSEQRQQAHRALYHAITEGEVPGDLVSILEGVVTLVLETGRARHLYRAEGERVLTELFRKTPGGEQLSDDIDEVNRALARLKGEPLSSIRVNMRTLGHFTIRIDTETTGLTLAIRSNSVAVESVNIGGS